MIELEFLGRGVDGETLVFSDANGNRFSAPITEELRSSIRHSPTEISVADAPKANLTPAAIQSLLRQGFTVAEISSTHGVDADRIRRYEGPIQAEKEWAIRQALSQPLGNVSGAPTLEELVVNRLAARGVDPTTLTWSASKREGTNWEIQLTFVLGALERQAHWRISSGSKIQAIDQEAAWLTESTSANTIRANTAGVERSAPTGSGDDLARQAELLDRLNAQRGRPQTVLEDIDGEAGGEASFDAVVDGTADMPSGAGSATSIAEMLMNRRARQKTRVWEPTEAELAPVADVFAGIDEAVLLGSIPTGNAASADSAETGRETAGVGNEETVGETSGITPVAAISDAEAESETLPLFPVSAADLDAAGAPPAGSAEATDIDLEALDNLDALDDRAAQAAIVGTVITDEAAADGAPGATNTAANAGSDTSSEAPKAVSDAAPEPAASPVGDSARERTAAFLLSNSGQPNADSPRNEAKANQSDVVDTRKTPPIPPKRGAKKSGRAPMPSWDEIVFGTKHD